MLSSAATESGHTPNKISSFRELKTKKTQGVVGIVKFQAAPTASE
jgi:hypothetical protein